MSRIILEYPPQQPQYPPGLCLIDINWPSCHNQVLERKKLTRICERRTIIFFVHHITQVLVVTTTKVAILLRFDLQSISTGIEILICSAPLLKQRLGQWPNDLPELNEMFVVGGLIVVLSLQRLNCYEQRSAKDHLEYQTAKGPYVDALAETTAENYLWGSERDWSDDFSRL